METHASLTIDRGTAPQAAGASAPEVIARLEHFQVIRSRWIRAALDYAPALLGILLLADWLVGNNVYTGELFLLTAALTIILELLLLRALFAQTPRALLTLWTRGLFMPDGDALEPALLDYIGQFERALNGRWGWWLGGAFALTGVGLTYPVLTLLRTGALPFSGPQTVSYYLLSRPVYLYLVLGCLIGLMAWRGVVIAWYLSKLGQRFELKIMPNHPDRCGGFKPLGNLCLTIALLLLVPAIYFAIWASLGALFGDNPRWAIYTSLWAPAFRQILAVLSILGAYAFFMPLTSIHEEMLARKREIEEELDHLSQEIDAIMLELRTQPAALTPEQASQKLERISFLQKVYQEQTQIPTWPFDWKLIARFSAAQAAPLLTLLGTSKPVIDLAASLLGSVK